MKRESMARGGVASTSASSLASSSLDALGLLSARFEDEGRPIEAIQCLLAVLGLKPLPDAEARARLQLGRLLIEHTSNVKEATQHLQQARLLFAKLLGHHPLRAEVQAQLALCFKTDAQPRYEADALRHGLDVCQAQLGQGLSERRAMCAWACFFHHRLAEAAVESGRLSDARDSMSSGMQVAQEESLPQQQVLFLLLRLQLSLAAWDAGDTAATMGLLTALVGDAQRMASLPPDFADHAMLHFSVLQVLDQVRQGLFADLQELVPASPDKTNPALPKPAVQDNGAPPDTLLTIHSLRSALADLRGKEPGYTWLHPDALDALLHVLAALILRCSKTCSQLPAALLHLQAAQAGLDAHLMAMGMPPNTPESQLPFATLQRCRTPLLLKVMAYECRVQIELLQSAPNVAGAAVMEAAVLLMLHPHLLRLLRPTVHFMAGQYCHFMGDSDDAVAHLQLARQGAGAPNARASASVLLALSLLATGKPDAVSQAIAALGALYSGDVETLGYMERTSGHLAAATIKAQLGDKKEAEFRLKKALKAASRKLSSLEVVSCVFGALGPLYLAAQDVQAARQMAITSVSTTKNVGDFIGLCQALPIVAAVQRHEGNEPGAVNTERSLADKQARLAACRARAVAAPLEQHARIRGLVFPSS